MELKKKIETGSLVLEDGADRPLRVRLVDITLTNGIISFGELRVDNSDGSFSGKFVQDAEIKVSISLVASGDEVPRLFFTGIIEKVVDDTLILLTLKGSGIKLLRKKIKLSLNAIDSVRVFNDILKNSPLPYELGKLARFDLHSYIMREASVSEQLHRAIGFLGLDFEPYVDRAGILKVKTRAENTKATTISFALDELKKMESMVIETILDTEIDIYNKIKAGDLDYLVTTHRIYCDEHRSKSFISLDEI